MYHVYFGEMTKNFQLIFCAIYQWFKKTFGEDDMPQYSALLAYTLLLAFNILALGTYIERIVGRFEPFSKVQSFILFLLLLSSLYFYFIKNRRYIQLCKKHKHTLASNRSKAITLAYICLSLSLFLSLFFL